MLKKKVGFELVGGGSILKSEGHDVSVDLKSSRCAVGTCIVSKFGKLGEPFVDILASML